LERGGFVAKATEHHDHITDFTNSSMRERHGSDWGKRIPSGTGGFLNRIEDFVIGFRPTVVCEDCNNAETRAKGTVMAPKYFSFAPSEIRRFVVPVPHATHKVEVKAAAEVFGVSQLRFEKRIAAAQRLLDDALTGSWWEMLR